MFDVVNPTISPTAYPPPAALILLIVFTTPPEIVTVAVAPEPLPVIANRGTLVYCPFEYPIPVFVMAVALIGPPVDSIKPIGPG